MIAEIGIGLVLTISGFVSLSLSSREPGPFARVWLAFPMGAAIYLLVAISLVLIAGTLEPGLALGLTAAVGAVMAVIGVVRKTWGPATVKSFGMAVLLTAAVVGLARLLHLTRLTPDSIRYLIFANNLQLDDALGQIHRSDLMIRQIGLPTLHALSSLTDRGYLASLGPLFGVSGLGFFIWFVSRATRDLATASKRTALVVTASLFLASSNRLVYDAFYINTHIEAAFYVLVAVAGSWLAVVKPNQGWALPAGVSLGAVMLFRPEAPLVVAIILVAIAASRATWGTRWATGLPPLMVTVLWYGLILWRHGTGAGEVSLTSPTFGNMAAVTIAFVILVAGGSDRLSRVVRYADRVMLAVMALALIALGISQGDVLVESVRVTFLNVYHGMWMLTWPIAVAALVVAVMVHRVPLGRLWTTPLLGFGMLFWLLPLLRDGAFRVGTGDSGNRILGHFLAVVVAFLVLAASDFDDPTLSDFEGQVAPPAVVTS